MELPHIQLILGIIGTLLAVLTMVVGAVKYVLQQMSTGDLLTANQIEKLAIRLDTSLAAQEAKVSVTIEKESKARHDLANNVQRALTEMGQKQESYAKREEMRETEQRLTQAITKVGDKVDKLSESMATINTLQTTMTQLNSQLDRMSMRMDNMRPPPDKLGGGD